jgi:hypothetical protein
MADCRPAPARLPGRFRGTAATPCMRRAPSTTLRKGRRIATVGVTARGNTAGRWSVRLLRETLNGEGAEFRVLIADLPCLLELI